jgi:hypothetical protein
MRDPKRIARIVIKIQTLWYMYPDMRLFQFILALGESIIRVVNKDLFFLEDTDLEPILDDLIKKGL